MTFEIALVFGILIAAILLFVTGWLRMDLVALLVLVTLGLTGLVTPAQAFSGFSNPAVITVWAMFVISAGLSLTGVADRLGARITRTAGTGEFGLIVTIMATSGLLSAVMNNVGVAALLLPVVITIARQTGRPPSRLLMPLAYGCLLGGLMTLIGTPPNILASEALRVYGLPPFRLLDFTPIGVTVLVVGIAFVTLIGRRLLPERDPVREGRRDSRDISKLYDLGERLFTVRLPPGSPLADRTLAECRLGSALRLNVVAVFRGRRSRLAPTALTVLRAGDRLLALGRPDQVAELRGGPEPLERAEPADQAVESLMLVEARVPVGSPLVGRTVLGAGLRQRLGVNVLAIRRGDSARFRGLQDARIQQDDVLLIQGSRELLEVLADSPEFDATKPAEPEVLRTVYRLPERFHAFNVPAGSKLADRTLAETRLGDALGLTVWGIRRDGEMLTASPDEPLREGDTLFADGAEDVLTTLRALRELEIESHPVRDLATLSSGEAGLVEVVLAPQSSVEGKTPRELEFRERYGLTVLAVWRGGQALRSGLRDVEPRLGDAILLHGPRDHVRRLTRDPDFVVVSEPAQGAPRPAKAPLAVGIVAAVLAPAVVGWVPIALAAVTGAALLVLFRCVTMEEAYRNIEWQAVFLIAGMLPLGIAMEQTGAARLAGDMVIAAVGGWGPRGVLAGLFLLTSAAVLVVHPSAMVVLMAPIAFNAATDMGVSPLPFMMAIAVAAAASLSSPISHPANLLIMGPGGYRFGDYLRLGLPLTFLIFVIVLVLAPLLWPFGG